MTETPIPYEGADRTTLGQTGQILVTLRAAEEYAAVVTGLDPDEVECARRELTEALISARRAGSADNGAERWRARSRITGLDITARVAREGPLAVVTTVNVRSYGRKG